MKIHWSKIDWSLTDAEIADLTGRALGTVRNRRSQFAPGSAGSALRSNALDWAAVDWSASNEKIAATHCRALRTVQLNRLKENPNPRKIPPAAAWDQIDWTFTNAEIARFLGVSKQAVHSRRKRLQAREAATAVPVSTETDDSLKMAVICP